MPSQLGAKANGENKNIFLYKLIIIIVIQALSILLIKSSSISLKFTGVVLLGLINAHSIQIIHQCSHFLGFKNKKINDLVGSLLGLQVFINFSSYREVHFQHHKKLGTAEDTEFFGLDKLNKASNMLQFVQCVFGLSKYNDLMTGILKKKEATSGAILKNVVFLNLIIMTGLVFIGQSDLVITWVLSLILITEPVHFLIEIPEHYGCKKISKEKYENTRTIKSASKVARWFTNWNNFHVEHHLNQWIFPENLEPFFDEEKASRYNPIFNNYFEFYSFFIKDVMKREAK